MLFFSKRHTNSGTIDKNGRYGTIQKKIDVVIMCGGSAKDLPNQVTQFAKIYNTVDSFDTHKNIPEYIEKINRINRESNTISLISAGWDPGLFQ